MEMLKKMLKNREENQASISAKRLDRLWVKKQKEKAVMDSYPDVMEPYNTCKFKILSGREKEAYLGNKMGWGKNLEWKNQKTFSFDIS